MIADPVNLDGCRLRIVSTDPHGVVSADAILTLRQIADVVTRQYDGGTIIAGFLAGRVDTVGQLRFCYAQTDGSGRIDCGTSTATIERLSDGRLKLIEQFKWFTRPDVAPTYSRNCANDF